MPKIINSSRLLLLAAVILLALVQAGSLIGLAWVMQKILHNTLESITSFQSMLIGILVLLVVISALCRWFERIVSEWLGNHYAHEVRLKMFDALTTQTDNSQDRQQGIHIVRFSNDLSALRQWVAMGLPRLISSSLFLLGVIVALITIELNVASAVGIALLASLLMIAAASLGLEQSIRKTRRTRGRLANTVSNIISNVSCLTAYGRTPKEGKRLARKSTELGKALVQNSRWIGGLRALTDFGHRAATFTALIVGSYSLQSGQIAVSDLLAILGVTALIGTPMRDLGRVFEYWKSNQVALEKINHLFSQTKRNSSKTQTLPKGQGHLIIKELSLGNLFHIKNISVDSGKRIALMGENGVGKSTLLQVITGLVTPDKGEAYLDDAATYRLSHSDRRKAIGIASHHLPLMAGSLSKNIRYRKPKASDKDVELISKKTGADQVAIKLTRGYETRLGPLGAGISDGETARVKLARALLGHPRLLIFDEIESGLDTKGVILLKKLLAEYSGTIIYATHDKPLAALADEIWHLESSRIVCRPVKKINEEKITA